MNYSITNIAGYYVAIDKIYGYVVFLWYLTRISITCVLRTKTFKEPKCLQRFSWVAEVFF